MKVVIACGQFPIHNFYPKVSGIKVVFDNITFKKRNLQVYYELLKNFSLIFQITVIMITHPSHFLFLSNFEMIDKSVIIDNSMIGNSIFLNLSTTIILILNKIYITSLFVSYRGNAD